MPNHKEWTELLELSGAFVHNPHRRRPIGPKNRQPIGRACSYMTPDEQALWRAGLSRIRKQFEEERPIPSCEVHLAGDGAWHRVCTQDVQRHASNDRQIARRVVLASSGVILAKHHIELA